MQLRGNLFADGYETSDGTHADESGQKNLRARTAWLFAAAVLALGVFVWALRDGGAPKELEDTYSDPYMAYAQIEKSFKKIGDSMEKGSQKARESERQFQTFRKVFDNK